MGDDLDRRLDRIERRQRYTHLLLVYPYLVWVLWVAAGTGETDATRLLLAVVPALAIVPLGYLRALYRARSGAGA